MWTGHEKRIHACSITCHVELCPRQTQTASATQDEGQTETDNQTLQRSSNNRSAIVELPLWDRDLFACRFRIYTIIQLKQDINVKFAPFSLSRCRLERLFAALINNFMHLADT